LAGYFDQEGLAEEQLKREHEMYFRESGDETGSSQLEGVPLSNKLLTKVRMMRMMMTRMTITSTF
jgi:hypothetical protein